MNPGKVYIVGAGPGDPDLITVKGKRCIETADVILYDRLINPELLEYAKSDADLIYCGKLPGYHTMKQETINHFLIKFAMNGKIVTRLKGGDPFVFGRGGEEAESLKTHGIAYEIIPGITSGIAASAYAGIPVTHRKISSSVAFVTGHGCDESKDDIEWDALARGVQTLVVYMGMKHLPEICRKLMASGKAASTPVALVHWGTKEDQVSVTGTLETITAVAEQKAIENPTIIVIGDVVRLREQLMWFEPDLQVGDQAL